VEKKDLPSDTGNTTANNSPDKTAYPPRSADAYAAGNAPRSPSSSSPLPKLPEGVLRFAAPGSDSHIAVAVAVTRLDVVV
jgi:hypothetical protein